MALLIDWPAELPQSFEADGFSYTPGSNILRSDVDVGPPKVRVRSTADTVMHSGSMIMTKIEFATYFIPFYKGETVRGTLPFDFPNPFDDGATEIEVRFYITTGGDPFKVKQHSPDSVRVSFTLEELPT